MNETQIPYARYVFTGPVLKTKMADDGLIRNLDNWNMF
jgi:hypothetical protein